MDENRKVMRCAIYTRKSTEEGLEQNFNTLQAQRESAEAYIRSQQLAGWVALDERYDDGGFSGASLERPAMKELLRAIEAGKIDCVVVYKVDRLSRSLLDFARLMSVFDGQGVSFVSVTQEFNTTTSLGRLTLNILLSFAQFEREIISERTRDKLSAARKKGKWIGGIPVLGYDVDPQGGRLVVNPEEAIQVREIFAVSEQAGTLAASLSEVHARGIMTKDWHSRGGRPHQGKNFSKQGLSALLSNVLYKGCIQHKGTVHAGEQEAIVDCDLWETVNRTLTLNRAAQHGRKHRKQEALLAGMARCGECGAELKPTFTMQGRRHVYYICAQGKRDCRQRPVAAQDLESSLRERLEKAVGRQPSTFAIQQAIERVRYSSVTRIVQVTLRDSTRFDYSLAAPLRRGVRGTKAPITGRIPRISKLMALAIKMEGLVREGKVSDYTALAAVGHVSKPRLTQIMNLTNLAPRYPGGAAVPTENHAGSGLDHGTPDAADPGSRRLEQPEEALQRHGHGAIEAPRKRATAGERTPGCFVECRTGVGWLFAERVKAFAVLFDGLHPQTHAFAELAAEEATHAVRLPAGGFHEGLQARSRGAFEQCDDAGGLGSLAVGFRRRYGRCGALLGAPSNSCRLLCFRSGGYGGRGFDGGRDFHLRGRGCIHNHSPFLG